MKIKLIIDPEKDEEAVITVKKKSRLTDEIEALIMNYEGNDRVTVQNDTSIKELNYNDIECVTVLDGRTAVISSDGSTYYSSKRLYEIEERLSSNFIRINKSTLANKNFIEKFTVNYGGGVDAIFKSGYRDYVSRRCFAKIKREVLK